VKANQFFGDIDRGLAAGFREQVNKKIRRNEPNMMAVGIMDKAGKEAMMFRPSGRFGGRGSVSLGGGRFGKPRLRAGDFSTGGNSNLPFQLRGQKNAFFGATDTLSMKVRETRAVRPPMSSKNSIVVDQTLHPDLYWSKDFDETFGRRVLLERIGAPHLVFNYEIISQYGSQTGTNKLVSLHEMNKMLQQSSLDTYHQKTRGKRYAVPRLAGVIQYSSQIASRSSMEGNHYSIDNDSMLVGKFTTSLHTTGPIDNIYDYWITAPHNKHGDPLPSQGTYVYFEVDDVDLGDKSKDGKETILVKQLCPRTSYTANYAEESLNDCVPVGKITAALGNLFRESNRNSMALKDHLLPTGLGKEDMHRIETLMIM